VEKAPLLEKIARQTFRASEIVNSLLNFSRTFAHGAVTVDLNKVIRETLTLMEHQFVAGQCGSEAESGRAAARIKSNAGKLQAGVSQSGAQRARRDGIGRATRHPHLDQRRAGARTVADTGAGIAAENLSYAHFRSVLHTKARAKARARASPSATDCA